MRERRSHGSLSFAETDAWGRPSAYEHKDSTFGSFSGDEGNREVDATVIDENAYRRSLGKVKRKLSDPDIQHPALIQLDSPVNSLIFDAPESSTASLFPDRESGFSDRPSPTAIGADAVLAVTPASPTLSGVSVAEATPCSLLSLSPVSGPTNLPEIGLDDDSLIGDWEGVLPTMRSHTEDDVVSLSGTSASGYEDAEAYTPISGTRSPLRLNSSPPLLDVALGGREMDLLETTTADDRPTRRGAMSVISVSESEGWGGDESDWTAGSENGN